MSIELSAATKPAFLKAGFFGTSGTGKTFTSAKFLSQFIARYCPEKQLAMYDTEGGAGYVAGMVEKITGKPLLVATAQSFPGLLEFAAICRKAGHVALCDSITHPWRALMADYLSAKKSRIRGMGGNPDSARLTMRDWGPIKDVWSKFTDAYKYDPVHWCISGREGDIWDERDDEDGKKEQFIRGKKMKTEIELGHEPSILVRMEIVNAKHRATVQKDRFDLLTGLSADDPDLAFFAPHVNALAIGGANPQPAATAPAFEPGHGPGEETLRVRRTALLENIKDDFELAWPGQTKDAKAARTRAAREVFGTSSWTELEKDERRFDIEALRAGREKLAEIVKGGLDAA